MKRVGGSLEGMSAAYTVHVVSKGRSLHKRIASHTLGERVGMLAYITILLLAMS
jgi:hypothetical protein